MSRKVLILKREDAGVTYGRVVKATDHMSMQDFAHAHVETVVRDLLMKGAAAARVSGFAYALAAGLQISVGPGHAVDALGRSFETYPEGQNAAAVFAQAHAAQPRIDLVYASLVADQDVEPQPMPHRRLLTPVEIAGGADPYPAENFDVFSQRQTRAVVGVRQGVAAALPVAPALGANEVALYHVRIEANAAALTADKVTDVRVQARSLEGAWAQLDALLAGQNESIDDRVAALIINSASVNRVYDDAAGTLTLNVEPEFIQDTVAAFITAGVGVAVAYNDVANTFTVSVTAEYIQDTVDGMLLVGAGLTKAYDDNANTLTLSVNLEYLQDQVAALLQVTASTGLSLVYDDAAGTLTLAGVAATGAAMGMMPAADKAKLDAATDANTASAIVRRDANGDFSSRNATLAGQMKAATALLDTTNAANRPALLTLRNLATGARTGSALSFGVGPGGANEYARIEQDFSAGGNNEGSLRFYLAQLPGAGQTEIFKLDRLNPHAKVFGNFEATGSISGGSKPFLIDHPLPELSREKLLRYVAVESDRADVQLRGRARLIDGRVEIDLDRVARQSPGTLLALARDLQAYVWNESKGAARWERVAWELVGAALVVESQDPTAALDLGFVVFGERHDPFIRHSGMTDENGRWVTELEKPAVAAEEVEALMAPRVETYEADEEAPDETHPQVVTELLGANGYLLHPEAVGEEPPSREVTVKTTARTEGETGAEEMN